MGDRMWLYATYHCNLACSYCLTESSPRVRDRRELPAADMLAAVRAAAPLGIARAGVTGGEVFMLPGIARVLAQMAQVMPTTALTNGTLMTERVLGQLAPLAGSPDFALQISLDSADPACARACRGYATAACACESRQPSTASPPPSSRACATCIAAGASPTRITSFGPSYAGAGRRCAAWASSRPPATSCPS